MPLHVLTHLLCCLSFYCTYLHFQYLAEHIPGLMNSSTDAIYRNNLLSFFSLISQFPCCSPSSVLLKLLVVTTPDWRFPPGHNCSCAHCMRCHKIYLSLLRVRKEILPVVLLAFRFQPLPVSKAVLCTFVAFVFSQLFSYQSVSSYLQVSAVHQLQITNGLPAEARESFPLLDYKPKGVRREGATGQRCSRLPITLELLCGIHGAWLQDLPAWTT